METPETNQAPAVEPIQAVAAVEPVSNTTAVSIAEPVSNAPSNALSNAAVTQGPTQTPGQSLPADSGTPGETTLAGHPVYDALVARIEALESSAVHVEAKLAGDLAEYLTKLDARIQAIEEAIETGFKGDIAALEGKVKAALTHIGADIRHIF